MKATGEVMAIAPNFEGALMKAVRSLELNVKSLRLPKLEELYRPMRSRSSCTNIDDERHLRRGRGSAPGLSPSRRSTTSPRSISGSWSSYQTIVDMEEALVQNATSLTAELLLRAKEFGFYGCLISPSCTATTATRKEIKALRESFGVKPAFKMVDTCAAEFDARDPLLSTPPMTRRTRPQRVDNGRRKQVLVLGSGPIRIGQGIEFDYCSVHCVWALKTHGLRGDHHQQQPGDRLHRLRHRRQAVLRAADPRGRA